MQIVFLFAIFVLFIVEPAAVNASECFAAVLNRTQSCQNLDLLYVTTQGRGSGLGSEFNFYFIYSLIHAMLTKRRLVFLISNRKWEYDCPHHHGWACYFQFSCPDSVVNASMIDLSNEKNTIHDSRFSSSRDPAEIRVKIGEVYRELFGSDAAVCDVEKQNPTVITSMVARHLYQLNNHTSSFVKSFNSRYGIGESKYISVQIRLDDKKYEMSPECWSWMTNNSNIFNIIKPYLQNYKEVFISTDNCTTVAELSQMMPAEVRVSSACLTVPSDSSSDIYKDLVGNVNPRKPGDFKMTLRAFADIEMLVHGEYFFGLLSSNLVRMVHRLRYPVMDKTIPLAQQFTDGDSRSRLDGLET